MPESDMQRAREFPDRIRRASGGWDGASACAGLRSNSCIDPSSSTPARSRPSFPHTRGGRAGARAPFHRQQTPSCARTRSRISPRRSGSSSASGSRRRRWITTPTSSSGGKGPRPLVHPRRRGGHLPRSPAGRDDRRPRPRMTNEDLEPERARLRARIAEIVGAGEVPVSKRRSRTRATRTRPTSPTTSGSSSSATRSSASA